MADSHAHLAPEVLLRSHGLRVTRPRVAVLAALASHPHAGADEVLRSVRADMAVSTQAVYDVLNTLAGRGVLRRIQPSGSVARYELRVGDSHHHVVCRQCGVVADVARATGAVPCLTADDDHGFVIDEAEVTWWGRCPTCADDPSTSTEERTHA